MRNKTVVAGVALALTLVGCSPGDDGETAEPTTDTTTHFSESSLPATSSAPSSNAPQNVNVDALEIGQNTWQLTAACESLVGKPEGVALTLGFDIPLAMLSGQKYDKTFRCDYLYGDGEGYYITVEQDATECSSEVSKQTDLACVSLLPSSLSDSPSPTSELLAWVDAIAEHVTVAGENTFPEAPAPPVTMPQPKETLSYASVVAAGEGRAATDACMALVGTADDISNWLGASNTLQLRAEARPENDPSSNDNSSRFRCQYHAEGNRDDGFNVSVEGIAEKQSRCEGEYEAMTQGGACLSFFHISRDDSTMWPPSVQPYDLQQWLELVAENITA